MKHYAIVWCGYDRIWHIDPTIYPEQHKPVAQAALAVKRYEAQTLIYELIEIETPVLPDNQCGMLSGGASCR